MVYMQPRANMSPVGRQPFRPGQWQGFKGVSKNTTYVQNNFFGGAYGNYYESAMNYDCGGNCGPSKLEKWMMGLGVGTTLLGGILSLFKKDKPQEQGGPVQAPVDTKQQDEIDKLKKRIAELEAAKKQPEVTPQQKPEVKPQQQPQVKPKEEPKPDPYADFGKNGIICRDEGGTRNITGAAGQINITKPGAAGQPPQEFTLTDTTENSKGNTYTYTLTGQTSDGKPIYSCTSKNGQPVSKGNQYIYDNGELVQKNGMDGVGSGLHTDAETAATPASPAAAPAGSHTTSSVQSNSANQGKEDPVDKIRNTVSTNRALSPERKTEITDLAESVQNSKLDDKAKADLLNKLDQMSHGMTLANDGIFAKTKSDFEAQIKKAETNATEEPKTTDKKADKEAGEKLGKTVADDLVGYTTDSEKQNVINTINNLNKDNIADFLEGYRKNKGMGNQLMEQINRESGWTNQEKISTQKQIVSNLIQKATEEGIKIPDSLNKFMELDDNAALNNTSASNLDQTINNILEQIKSKQAQKNTK